MPTIKDKIDKCVQKIYSINGFTKDDIRAAFRNVIEQVVEEIVKNRNVPHLTLLIDNPEYYRGYNERCAEEKATGENIIKSLE